jgi:hypothetical protein
MITVALAGLLGACSASSGGTLIPSATVPRSTESSAASLPPEVEDAVRFRTEFGLRADLAYIAQVARDPTATSDFGVPLLPSEVADLLRRQASATEVAPLLDAYGQQHPDEFAGWFQDQAHGGAFVVLFTANFLDHVHGLSQTLSGHTPPIAVQVKPAERTLIELEALQARIERDMAPWADRGIQIVFVGTRVSQNVVEIGVLAPAETAEQELNVAYGADAIRVFITDQPPQTD